MFTLYRKYKVATTISVQSLTQLEAHGQKENYRGTILSNCNNKVFTGNAAFEEIQWWSNEFGTRREWTYSNSMDMEKMEYDSKYGSVKWEFVKYFKEGKLQTLKQKQCAYKIRGTNGKPMVGIGNLSYMESKYKELQTLKNFDFRKFTDSSTSISDDDENSKKKFNLKNISFNDEKNEINPVQTDSTDSKYTFNDENAIITNFKKEILIIIKK